MPDNETAARLRAAFAYAKPNFPKSDRAKVLGVSPRTIARWQTHGTDLTDDQLEKLVTATGVPAWFFRQGFAAQPEPEEPTLAERVEALERKFETFRRPASDDPPPPSGELRRPPGAPGPTAGTDHDDGTDQDSDAASGTGR